jgi:hypothetical protein
MNSFKIKKNATNNNIIKQKIVVKNIFQICSNTCSSFARQVSIFKYGAKRIPHVKERFYFFGQKM